MYEILQSSKLPAPQFFYFFNAIKVFFKIIGIFLFFLLHPFHSCQNVIFCGKQLTFATNLRFSVIKIGSNTIRTAPLSAT